MKWLDSGRVRLAQAEESAAGNIRSHTALVPSPSLAVLHLPTYIHTNPFPGSQAKDVHGPPHGGYSLAVLV